MSTPHYHIDVFWHEPDGCWIANVPDLRFCSAHGGTPAEAVAEAQIAMSLWLDSAHDAGITIPAPRYRSPVSEQAEAA